MSKTETTKNYEQIAAFVNAAKQFIGRPKPETVVNTTTTLDYAAGKLIQSCEALLKKFLKEKKKFEDRRDIVRALNCATFQEGELKNVQIREGDKYQYTPEGEANCYKELNEIEVEWEAKEAELLALEIPINPHFVDVSNYNLKLGFLIAFEGFLIDPAKMDGLFSNPESETLKPILNEKQ